MDVWNQAYDCERMDTRRIEYSKQINLSWTDFFDFFRLLDLYFLRLGFSVKEGPALRLNQIKSPLNVIGVVREREGCFFN